MKKTILNIALILFLAGYCFGQVEELNIKAAYLEKFAMFTEWPDEEANDSEKPFVIAVFGSDSYYKLIKDFYESIEIRNKKTEVKFLDNIEKIDECNILFIGKVYKSTLKKIINKVKDKKILTVSDSEGYASEGVLINLFIADNKVRFEINEKAARSSGLVLSYHLLKYAKIVDPVKH